MENKEKKEILEELNQSCQIDKEKYLDELSTLENLKEFFDNEIPSDEFAVYVRRLIHVLVLNSFNEKNETNKEWIEEGYYWLTRFLEKIDPNLEK